MRRAAGCVGLVVLLLAGCSSPVGNGVAPTAIVIKSAVTEPVTGEVRAFQCFTQALTANIIFSDGSSSAFTNRATWASADPSVVAVSDGDIPEPGDSGKNYPRGTLIPVSPGTAVVTASFARLSGEVVVSVGAPEDLALHTENAAGAIMAPTALDLGVATTLQLVAVATLDGVEKNVSTQASWSVGSAAVGSVSSAGLLTALGSGEPTSVIASFPACSQTATLPLQVNAISDIRIVPAFGTQPLVIGNVEPLEVVADLADGSTEDVSGQAQLVSGNPELASLGTAKNHATVLLSGLEVGLDPISASLLNEYTASTVDVQIEPATLDAIQVQPATAALVAGSDQQVALTAEGTFDNGLQQDATRMVKWTSPNTKVVVVGTTASTAGRLTAGTEDGQVGVTATYGTDLESGTTVTVTTPGAGGVAP